MARFVLDASAVLAFLFAEAGSMKVLPCIEDGCLSALCYSEVLARAARLSGQFVETKRRVDLLKLAVVPFDAHHAALAAALAPATKPFGLSLADRACLALGMDRRLPIVTGDRDWAKPELDVELLFFR